MKIYIYKQLKVLNRKPNSNGLTILSEYISYKWLIIGYIVECDGVVVLVYCIICWNYCIID